MALDWHRKHVTEDPKFWKWCLTTTWLHEWVPRNNHKTKSRCLLLQKLVLGPMGLENLQSSAPIFFHWQISFNNPSLHTLHQHPLHQKPKRSHPLWFICTLMIYLSSSFFFLDGMNWILLCDCIHNVWKKKKKNHPIMLAPHITQTYLTPTRYIQYYSCMG